MYIPTPYVLGKEKTLNGAKQEYAKFSARASVKGTAQIACSL